MQKLKCYVAGFGAVEFQGETSQFLKSIHVNIIKDDTCKRAYSSYEEKMEFCAGKLETGTLWPGQYFSIFKMPDGRAPSGRPSRESIP